MNVYDQSDTVFIIVLTQDFSVRDTTLMQGVKLFLRLHIWNKLLDLSECEILWF